LTEQVCQRADPVRVWVVGKKMPGMASFQKQRVVLWRMIKKTDRAVAGPQPQCVGLEPAFAIGELQFQDSIFTVPHDGRDIRNIPAGKGIAGSFQFEPLASSIEKIRQGLQPETAVRPAVKPMKRFGNLERCV